MSQLSVCTERAYSLNDVSAAVSKAPDPVLFPEGMNTHWIRPGRSTWSWLNASRSVTPANMMRYAERASELGIEYNIVDGGWASWPDKFRRLSELCSFGSTLKPAVKTWVWVNFKDVLDAAERRSFFSNCRQAGVVGIKIDSMDAETKARVGPWSTFSRLPAMHAGFPEVCPNSDNLRK